MSRYNPKVFTNVDSLGELNDGLLIQLFKRFPDFFKAHNISLENVASNFEEVTKAFISPSESVQDSDETNELMEALQLITEMSSQDAMDSLLLAAKNQNITIDYQPDSSPADIALYCFLNQEDLFHTEYAKALVKNYRGFSFFWGGQGQKRDFPDVTEDGITALQSELDEWFASNNRLRNCRVYMFPQGHRVSIVIKYGKPLKRELKMKDGETESVFYNPQCHDLLIYNCNTDDISVRTDGKKGQLPEYLRCIGKHIFGSESYFDEKKVFSLDKLREIQTADHNFASVDGIEDVKLVELQYDWGGEIEIRKSGNLLGTLIRKNGLESTSKANIIYAKFSVRFEGSNTPRKVGIRSGNQATFGRDEDSLIIEDWINDQQLIIPKIQDKRHHNMWKKLANLPRHKHNHAFLVRHFGQKEIIKSLFDSTTVLDDNLHCENGCCCGRRICEMPNGKLLAVCNDDSSNCPDLVISNNDRRIFSLSLKKIAALIADLIAELAQNISVFKDVQTIDGTSRCIRVGHYIPRGTIRYPVFFGIDIYDGDLESIINHVIGLDGSAILMMPSIDNISQSKINAIRAKGSSLISLQDLTNTDTLIDTAKASKAFSAFREDQKDPMPEVSCVLFPTPADSEWSNITIKFTDGHTVRVTCNTGNNRVSQVYNFTQMGMADGRTASPNKQWNLLESFAEERGQFTWDNPKANGNQKKQKQELKKVFQKFFGIYDSDPFEDYKDHKNRVCYRSKFHISPDE